MPRGDGTGPMGMGPLTGRAFGFCAGFRTPGFVNPGTGAGLGRGCGYGRGFRRMSSFGTVRFPLGIPFSTAPLRRQRRKKNT